jgi:hypothetical protein
MENRAVRQHYNFQACMIFLINWRRPLEGNYAKRASGSGLNYKVIVLGMRPMHQPAIDD